MSLNFFDVGQLDLFWSLLLALVLGSVVGLERERVGKEAGLRTNALVSVGSALFTILSVHMASQLQTPAFDPSRIASQVVVGIGFIGAGLIIFRGERIENLTTAATVWVVAAIGMAVGFGMYLLAILTTLLVYIFLEIAQRFKPREHKSQSE
ncbi:MgtC/SapB family protein [Candidatus Parcubacteria bacterium]|nr:MAG: MgtC/SapB family protein [Candidatus Parcubacteria bacterium]